MEKKLHDDRLDDYVKKSFEEYEEDPSGDMWSRIEGDLPPTEITRPVSSIWFRYRWQLAAATVIVLLVSRLICVQSYYEEKLRLAAGSEQVVPEMPAFGSNHLQAQETLKQDASAKPYVSPAKNTPIQGKTAKAPRSEPNEGPNTTQPKPEITPGPKPLPLPVPSETVVFQSTSASKQAESQTPSQVITDHTNPTFESIPPPIELLAQVETPIPALLNRTSPTLPSTVDAPIKPFVARTGWYLGMAFTPNLIVEKQQTIRRPGPRPRFTNHQERPQPSVDLSLRVGKKLNRQFAIETGIGYQQLSKTATHSPKFEYREGHLMQGGNMGERSFEYDLNTYGGSAEVSLRTEVAGMSAPGENDRVAATIESTEKIQLVKVPLSIVGRFGQSRLQAIVSGGLVGNFIAKNEFEITASQMDNPRLRFRMGDAYNVQFNNPQRFVLGYQLAGGVEFHLNKNLSIAATPRLTGDFPRTDSQGSKLPEHTAFGMNVSANWWF